jgi:hypothetical protein
MKRPWVVVLLALMFALLSVNAFLQVGLVVMNRSDDPGALALLQALSGIAGALAAVGAWRRTGWAALASAGYGVVTATMLGSLPYLLGLEREARLGIWSGATLVLLFGIAGGLYLHRVRDTPPSPIAEPPSASRSAS